MTGPLVLLGWADITQLLDQAIHAKPQSDALPLYVPASMMPRVREVQAGLNESLHQMPWLEPVVLAPPHSADQNQLLREALAAALEWIDAVPKSVVLPAMPGFDRDEVGALLSQPAPAQPQGASPEDMAVYNSIAAGYPAQPQGAGEVDQNTRAHGYFLGPLPDAEFKERFYAGYANEGLAEWFSPTQMREYARQQIHIWEEQHHPASQDQGTGEAVAEYIGECPYGDLVRMLDDLKPGTKLYTTPPASQQAAQAVPANLPEAITIACGLLAQSADDLEAGHEDPELIELHRKTIKQLGEGLRAMKGGQQ
jgi:hypothetical protein